MNIKKLKASFQFAKMRADANPSEQNLAILEQARSEYEYALDPEKKTEEEEMLENNGEIPVALQEKMGERVSEKLKETKVSDESDHTKDPLEDTEEEMQPEIPAIVEETEHLNQPEIVEEKQEISNNQLKKTQPVKVPKNN